MELRTTARRLKVSLLLDPGPFITIARLFATPSATSRHRALRGCRRVGTMRANCSLSISSPSEIVAFSPRVTAASCVRWRRAALQPQRSETFKLSTDRLFVDKVRGIVGLCPRPTGPRTGGRRLARLPQPTADARVKLKRLYPAI